MLSPAELFAVRSREKSLPQGSHGQKDFLADGTDAQSEKLRLCRAEQWELLGEERVERLGSLVRGVWRPQQALVELMSPAGKFWQTTGFTERGRQWLLPEEALYLLECGSVQLFYRDLPLSVQEAYARLLTQRTVTVLQYQVYSHLKRLGYIVTRFCPSSIQSPYKRRLNPESRARPPRKRKRSSSPRLKADKEPERRRETEDEGSHLTSVGSSHWPGNKSARADPESSAAEQEVERDRQAEDQTGSRDRQADGQSQSRDRLADDQSQSRDRLADDQSQSRDRQAEVQSESQDHQVDNQSESSVTAKSSRTSRWDFSAITFPNCAPDSPRTLLPEPGPALLPENVAGREADMSHWLRRLNLRPEKLSRREREQQDWERRYKSSVNADPGVRRCANWGQYKDLLQERRQRRGNERPPHLWADTVTPLLCPGHAKTTACVLDQITVTAPSLLLDGAERLQSASGETSQIHFNVYQADTAEFKKSKPGKPYARMCVRRLDEQIPSLRTVTHLAGESGDVPVVFALVDTGEVAFYSFKGLQLPVDVYP